ncbi:MAG: TRAM domain-containing protein, partial [Acidimicrobiia bacterium]
VVDEASYDAAYTFVFSPRPGTRAAEMTDEFVAPDVARARMERLVAVVERHALAHHGARVGKVEEVLVDGPSKTDPDVLSGRTRQGKLVHFEPLDTEGVDGVTPGAYVDVRVTGAAPHWLRGEHLATTAAPRRTRSRIPVTAV